VSKYTPWTKKCSSVVQNVVYTVDCNSTIFFKVYEIFEISHNFKLLLIFLLLSAATWLRDVDVFILFSIHVIRESYVYWTVHHLDS